jgi:Protein of unknown function (DUF2950)
MEPVGRQTSFEEKIMQPQNSNATIGSRAPRFCASAILLCLLVFTAGCQKSEQPAAPIGPKTFANPEAAAKSLYDAAKSGDSNSVLAIFSPDAKDYLLYNDPEQDKIALSAFVADYDKMHRWSKVENDGEVLDVGVESYPFPFPLLKNSSGQWFFDTTAAKKEFLARRIGDNELTVVDILNAMADAQSEYFSQPQLGSKVKQYAQKFTSSEGRHDGLYWKAPLGKPESPLGPLAARASAEGYKPGTADALAPFHGYFFRILPEQGPNAYRGAKKYIVKDNMTGGFAFLAYPAEYRSTGVMTFIINQDGDIYEKDLGPETSDLAKSTTAFDPDNSWSVVE